MTRSLNKVWLATIVCLVTLQDVSPRNSSQSADTHQSKPPQTKQDIDQLMAELSNWGRWGKDDRLGTMNLITAEKCRKAANLVKEGYTVSLARPVEKELAADNPDPFGHKMTLTGINNPGQFAADTYSVAYHGHAHTHIDALGHMFYEGKMYNGTPQETITEKGSSKLSIMSLQNGVFSRGILMDIPRLKGGPYLEPGVPIYPEDLEAWEKKAGILVGSGDVVIVRTGRWACRAAKGAWDAGKMSAGLHAACAAWLKKRDIAVLGSDDGSDVAPSGIEGVSHPIHQLMLIAAGIHVLDCCDLEALSAACQKRQRWEFLITIAPLAVPGGTGSPVNPVAVF
jgi:kynurenine formamidase